MKVVLTLAAALAMPVAADDPAFVVGIGCEGGLPMVIQIQAVRPGVTMLTLPDLMAFCAAQRPVKHRWQGGA